MKKTLKIEGLKKYYGKDERLVKAVDGIDLEIGRASCRERV